MLAKLAKLISIPESKGLGTELVRGGLGNGALRVISALLGFSISVVLARLMGAEHFGIYAYVIALVSVLAVPAEFGLPTLVLRETAAMQAHQRWALMRGLWRLANMTGVAIALALIVVGGVSAWLMSGRLAEERLAAFMWGLSLVPLVVLGNLRGAALKGLRKVVQGQLPEYLVRPGLLMVLVLSGNFLVPEYEWTAPSVMQLQVVAATIAFVIGAWLLSRARPQELAGVTAEYCTRSWLASVFPLAATAGMQLINHHTDIVMLGLFRSAEEVGVYRVSVVGASLVIFGLQIINMVVAPHFARLYSIGERDQLQRVVTASARIALFTALPAVLVFLLFGETLLQVVFGVEFARAYVPLTILAVGQLVNAGAGSVGYLLNMTGHERDTTRGVAIAAGMNVVLNVVLIPAFGMAGAAMATTASLVIWNVILWRAVRTRLGINSMAFNFFGIRSAT